jgi:hypothetical protein
VTLIKRRNLAAGTAVLLAVVLAGLVWLPGSEGPSTTGPLVAADFGATGLIAKIGQPVIWAELTFQNRGDQPVELDGFDLATRTGPVVIDTVKIAGPERALDGGAWAVAPGGPTLSDLEPIVDVDGAVIGPEPTQSSYLVVLVMRVTGRGRVDLAGARLRYHQGSQDYVLEIPGKLRVCAPPSLFETECRNRP